MNGGYKLTLKQGNYIVSRLNMPGFDRTKLHNEPTRISSTAWACTSKQKLIEYAEQHKSEKVKALELKLLTLKQGEVIIT